MADAAQLQASQIFAFWCILRALGERIFKIKVDSLKAVELINTKLSLFFCSLKNYQANDIFSQLFRLSIFSDLDFGSKKGSTIMTVNQAFSIIFQWNLLCGFSIHIKFGWMIFFNAFWSEIEGGPLRAPRA